MVTKYVYPRESLLWLIPIYFGDQASFKYKDLIPLFTADPFDPASLVDSSKAGACSIFFQLRSTTMALDVLYSLSPYNSLEMKRDEMF